MGEEGKGEPLHRQVWFWAMLRVILIALGLVLGFWYFGYQSGFFGDVARRLLGPSPARQAEQRAFYDQAMADLEEAIRTGDTSILEQRWCGDAREWAEQMAQEGGKQRLRVLKVEYGLGFPAPMSVDEVWIAGTTEMSYTNKVRFNELHGCIIIFDPTMLQPEGEIVEID